MIINGKQIAEEILEGLKREIGSRSLKLRLAAILVGEDPEFKKFVEFKGKKAEEVGIEFKMVQFDKNIDEADMIYHIEEVVKNFDGILIELPLPKHLNQQKILDIVPMDKDVDVLSSEAQKLFYENKSKILPPAVEALKIVLEKYELKLKGKKVAVFGQGILVGKPISDWLERQGGEIYRIRSKTANPEQYSSRADIVVTGVGKPDLITGSMVKDGVVVIDFGYGKDDEGRMRGDVDYNSVAPKASLITSVPGGMGPVLIAAVIKNLIILSARLIKSAHPPRL